MPSSITKADNDHATGAARNNAGYLHMLAPKRSCIAETKAETHCWLKRKCTSPLLRRRSGEP